MLFFKQLQGIDGFTAAKGIREEVFITEQGFSYDYDEYDKAAWHIIGYDGDTVIAAARVYPLDEKSYKIGRMAVKKEYRGQYVGDLIIKTLQDKIVTLGGIEAVVEAQLHAKGFYTYEGYTADGEAFEIEGVPHIRMKLDLTKPVRHCNCKL